MKYRNSKNADAAARYWGKSLDRPDWYNIDASTDTAEIIIYDVIGWPYNDSSELVRSLAEMGDKNVTVKINSPGGDVFDGIAIFNALREHKGRVTTQIDSLAASIASVIALAGDDVTAHKNSMFMIHEPWTIAAGNQHDFTEIADVLGKISGNLLEIYSSKAGGKRELKDMMRAETWFTATEAQKRGFIDRVIDKQAAKASFDLSMYASAPDGFHPEGRDLNEREIERALRDAGASRSFAKSVVADKFKFLRDADLKIETEKLINQIQRKIS